MSSKGRKSRKISDDEEANTSGHYTRKKQKTGECAQDSTTKQPAVSCRKISDEEEANTLEHHKKQKTGECVQLSTEKQSAPNCSSTTVNNEENASQNSMLEIKPSKTSASSTKLTLTADLKSEPEETEEYKAARLKNLLHGISYQLMLLIYFIQRGLEKHAENEQYAFALATEMAIAEDFDDLVFRYRENNGKWVYRFLQAKHKLDNKKQITATDLLSVARSNNDFGLKKYFESFRKIKTHPHFKNGMFKDFIICTNIGLQNHDHFKPVEENDEILNFKKENAKLLKLDFAKFPQKAELRSILEGTSHDVSENEITDFFENLVFAIDMPDESALSKIIAENMSQQFNLKDSKLATNHFFRHISKWMNSKKAYFFKNEHGETCFKKIKLRIEKLEVNGITLGYLL